MWTTIGTLLPFSLGVAISPIPIIAVILMLFSPHAAVNGPLFLAGWVLALTAVCTVFLVVARLVGAGDGGQGASAVGGAIHIVLGVLFLGAAAQMMKNAPKEGERRKDPGWMKVVETATPSRAARLGSASCCPV
ncbi:GAP family protein [Streptomyces anulatus]|uniref:GAP family protein n=1 Tax=Streptomyces anulatus TaxID=1892 RepID=UPI00364BD2F8